MSWTPTERMREAAFDAWQNTSASLSVRERLDAVLVAVGPMIAAQAFRDFAVEKRAEWAPRACPWVGALDDRATQIEKEAGR